MGPHRHLLLFLLLVAVAVGTQSTTAGGKQPPPRPQELVTTLTVPVSSSATYGTFMREFELRVNQTRAGVVAEHSVLGPEQLRLPPPYWIKNVHGRFCFAGEEGTFPRGTTALTYRGDYASLFGDHGPAGLGRLPINSTIAYDHARILADYRDRYVVTEEQLKPSLGFYVLGIAEAQRFPGIRDAVADRIASGGLTIPESLTRLAVNWARVSCAVLSWSRHGMTKDAWDKNEEAGELKKGPLQVVGADGRPKKVDTAQEALSLVGPLLQGRKCSWT
ncbi:hypothetical protein D1007_16822 [Hordeum vulgare]|nr:hypothetical protein D1007_16822 [Hordeum vulgare]KAI5015739.1 hypothetical protein ZWY2020_057129 [Hordeum vulgare]